MLVRERVRFETGLLFSRCAALLDLVCRLADAVPAICPDSGTLFNLCLINLGGLGSNPRLLGGLDVVTGLRVAVFGGDFLLMFIFILLGGLFILNGVAAAADADAGAGAGAGAGPGTPRVLAARLCAASCRFL